MGAQTQDQKFRKDSPFSSQIQRRNHHRELLPTEGVDDSNNKTRRHGVVQTKVVLPQSLIALNHDSNKSLISQPVMYRRILGLVFAFLTGARLVFAC